MKANEPKYMGGERGQGCLGIASGVHGSKIEIYFNIKSGAQRNIWRGICFTASQKLARSMEASLTYLAKWKRRKIELTPKVTVRWIGDEESMMAKI
jgi:hypothetical protein